MLKIYLARHGQDEDNVNNILNGHRDTPLTEKGLEQAREVAQRIKDANIYFEYIYSSPLKRAHKTAEVIAKLRGSMNVEILPDLIERDFGIMTGKSKTQIVELCSPEILQSDTITYFLSPEGAETFPDLIERGKRVLSIIKDRHQDGNILLVTHGDIGKMIYCAYYQLDWKQILLQFHFGNSELLELSPESPSEEAHVFKIEQYNN